MELSSQNLPAPAPAAASAASGAARAATGNRTGANARLAARGTPGAQRPSDVRRDDSDTFELELAAGLAGRAARQPSIPELSAAPPDSGRPDATRPTAGGSDGGGAEVAAAAVFAPSYTGNQPQDVSYDAAAAESASAPAVQTLEPEQDRQDSVLTDLDSTAAQPATTAGADVGLMTLSAAAGENRSVLQAASGPVVEPLPHLVATVAASLPKPLAPMRIALRPEGYGRVQILITTTGKAGGAEYRVAIQTADPAAHALLRANLDKLCVSLRADSVTLALRPNQLGPQREERQQDPLFENEG